MVDMTDQEIAKIRADAIKRNNKRMDKRALHIVGVMGCIFLIWFLLSP